MTQVPTIFLGKGLRHNCGQRQDSGCHKDSLCPYWTTKRSSNAVLIKPYPYQRLNMRAMQCVVAAIAVTSSFLPSPPPEAPEVIDVGTRTVRLRWPFIKESVSLPIEAYEIEMAKLANGSLEWVPIQSRAEKQRFERNVFQLVEVRVDAESRVEGGSFQLFLSWGGITPMHTDAVSVTQPIPFDASAATVEAAIEELENVENVRVRRCDSRGGIGGTIGWIGSCPYGTRGGYSWRVEFDTPPVRSFNARTQRLVDPLPDALSSPALPKLGVYKETITTIGGGRWTGPGLAVSTRDVTPSRIENELCGIEEWIFVEGPPIPVPACQATVDNLIPGELLAFRLRVVNAEGLSAPGPPSRFVRLNNANLRPVRPSPPVFFPSSRGGGRPGVAVFHVSTPRHQYRADAFQVQYRNVGAATWLDAGRVPLDPTGWASITLQDLEPGGIVETRSRGLFESSDAEPSDVFGDWSTASQPGVASRSLVIAPRNAPVLTNDGFSAVLASWTYDEPAPGLTFEFSLQEWRGRHSPWRLAPHVDPIQIEEPVNDADALDELQTVTIESEDVTFRLRLPNLTRRQTATLSAATTANALAVALEDAGFPAKGAIRVTKRELSSFANEGGVVWRVRFLHALDIVADAFPLLVVENAVPRFAARVERQHPATSRRFKSVLEARVDGIESDWCRARVRAIQGTHVRSDWSPPSAWLRLIPKTELPAQMEDRNSSSKIDGVLQETARDWRCARRFDPDYASSAGDGGRGGDGRDGLVHISAFTADSLLLTRATYFQGENVFTVPQSAKKLVAKLWGAGGGGVKSLSYGGGGGFLQASFAVASSDTHYRVIVGGGGCSGISMTPAACGQNGGGIGGTGEEDTGAGGGGASELWSSHGELLAVAGGGGGGGTDDGAHGGGGGGSVAGEGQGRGGGKGGNMSTAGASGGPSAAPGGDRLGGAGSIGGGGGGSGKYGGGGGETGGGGGGGASFVSLSSLTRQLSQNGTPVLPPRVVAIEHDAIMLSLSFQELWYHVEIAEGALSENFERRLIVSHENKMPVRITGLKPATAYRIRGRAASRQELTSASSVIVTATAEPPTDTWQAARLRENQARTGHRGTPSPRRGHTLTHLGGRREVDELRLPKRLLGSIYMFGGKGPGYDCDGAVGATYRFGSPTAGREIEVCASRPGVLNELWRFEPRLQMWHHLADNGPDARYRHVAAALNASLFVWGGRGEDDRLLNDMWRLDVSRPSFRVFNGQKATEIPARDVVYFSANGTSDDECIRDLFLIFDNATNTSLSMSLFGPSSRVGDGSVAPSQSVALPSNGFARADVTRHFSGIQPRGNFWTLRVRNDFATSIPLSSWRLEAVLETCEGEPTYNWTQATAGPPPMADPIGIAADNSLFISDVYGGQLWRYDAMDDSWTRLVGVDRLLDGFIGKAVVLTPFGIFGFGGFRSAVPQTAISQLDASLWRMGDLRDRRWRRVTQGPPRRVDPARFRVDGDAVRDRQFALARHAADTPRARDFPSLAYITESDRADSPALFLFGGHDATADLADSWFYNLKKTSLEVSRTRNHTDECAFNFRPGTSFEAWQSSCGATSTSRHENDDESANHACSLFDVLQRAYCLCQYQGISNFPY